MLRLSPKVSNGVLILLVVTTVAISTSYKSENDLENQTSFITEAIQSIKPSPNYVSEQKALFETGHLPQISWVGKVHVYMTYGRLLIQNLDPGADYKFFIIEPHDVIEDGGLRYSPTTRNLVSGNVILVRGEMSDSCYWENGFEGTDVKGDYKGCVPWIEIKKIESPTKVTSEFNNFSNLQWWTATIIDRQNCEKSEDWPEFCGPDINLEYPQFIGTDSKIKNLNKYIYNLVNDKLSKDRKDVNDWRSVKNKDNYLYEDCNDEHKPNLMCSVQLSSKYLVNGINNDIVSIEIVFTDFTGGGNGNHDESVTINYDLKTERDLKPTELFCNLSTTSLAPLLDANLIEQNKIWRGYARRFWANKDEDYPEESVDPSDRYAVITGYSPEDILIGYYGATIVYQPYIVGPGSVGIVRMFVPYNDLAGVVCSP